MDWTNENDGKQKQVHNIARNVKLFEKIPLQTKLMQIGELFEERSASVSSVKEFGRGHDCHPILDTIRMYYGLPASKKSGLCSFIKRHENKLVKIIEEIKKNKGEIAGERKHDGSSYQDEKHSQADVNDIAFPEKDSVFKEQLGTINSCILPPMDANNIQEDSNRSEFSVKDTVKDDLKRKDISKVIVFKQYAETTTEISSYPEEGFNIQDDVDEIVFSEKTAVFNELADITTAYFSPTKDAGNIHNDVIVSVFDDNHTIEEKVDHAPIAYQEREEPTIQNNLPTKSTKAIHYNISIGEFNISPETRKEIIHEGKLIRGKYQDILAKHFFDNISKGCVVQMKNINYHKKKGSKVITVYCYCSHTEKTQFRFDFYEAKSNEGFDVRVFTNATSCNHERKMTRQLSGHAREKMKQRLINESPILARYQNIKEADSEGLAMHNMQKIKSYDVYRTAKSEALAADDQHPDPLLDVMLMHCEQLGQDTQYIQGVYAPLGVVIFSKDVLEAARVAKNIDHSANKEFVVHIDATGQVVKMTEQCRKAKLSKIFYYAMVFRVNNVTLPLSEFISCQHSANDLLPWFSMLNKFLVKQKHWPLFTRLVSDWSWPIIISTLKQFNCMTVETYINTCYDIATNKHVNNKPVFYLHICVAHYIKTIINDVKSSTKEMDKNQRYRLKLMLMQAMCSIMQINNYDRIKKIIEHLLSILLSRYNTLYVEFSKEKLASVCKGSECYESKMEENETSDNNIETPDEKEWTEDKELYKKSKFYKDVVIIEKNVLDEIEKKNKENEEKLLNALFSPEMANLIVKKYFPYLCMWSGLMLPSSTEVTTRFSNALVEGWFSELKNVILKGKWNVRMNRFLLTVRDVVVAKVKEVIEEIPRDHCARRKRKADKKDDLKIKKARIDEVALQTVAVGNDNEVQQLPNLSNESNIDMPLEQKHSVIQLSSDDEDVNVKEESWKKKLPSRTSYFDYKYFEMFNVELTDYEVGIIQSLRLAKNGLIDDTNYYKHLPSNYLLCSHKAFQGRAVTKLRIESALRLDSEKWFCSELINCVAQMFMTKYSDAQSIIIDDSTATNLTSRKVKHNQRLQDPILDYVDLKENTKKIFLPINLRGVHWVLGYANIEKKEYCYLDPMLQKEKPEYFDEFKKLLQKIAGERFPKIGEGWKTVCYEHPQQKDGINCGAFIMYFIEQLMLNGSVSSEFDPQQYRKYLLWELIKESRDMTNYCGGCTVKLKLKPTKNGQSVQCNACNRWFHVHKKGCLPGDISKNMVYLQQESTKVFCTLCRKYAKTLKDKERSRNIQEQKLVNNM